MKLHQPSNLARPETAEWWKSAIIYQIYPRSFQDSNGDGIGDLSGIESRLDYLGEIGIDAIWISPIYPSPMADFGYDVSEYCGIDSVFGTLAEFDSLVAAARALGMKVLLDFVPSHSSDRHPWFQESRSSRDNPKRGWYHWRDAGPDGAPPNNWISEFSGPAWTWDKATSQFYLHFYLPEQPALNWRNPELRKAMLDVMRFWYDRGVDGFRVDAVSHLAPDPDLRSNPPNPDWKAGMNPARKLLRAFSAHQPAGHGIVREMRRVTQEYPDRLLIGEIYGDLPLVTSYYGTNAEGFHLPFNFALTDIPWDAERVAALVEAYEAALPRGAWPNWVLGNHDIARIATRAGSAQSRVAATLLLTLRGTPTIYQGDELGMENALIPPEAVQDPWEKRTPGLGRDPVRTPMPWTSGHAAGFTAGAPWLPFHCPPEGCVAAQADDPGSMLTFFKALTTLRHSEPVLVFGSYRTISARDDVLIYERADNARRLKICLNFSGESRAALAEGDVVLSSDPDRVGRFEGKLQPNEALILDG